MSSDSPMTSLRLDNLSGLNSMIMDVRPYLEGTGRRAIWKRFQMRPRKNPCQPPGGVYFTQTSLTGHQKEDFCAEK
jgi:hypothetical protein